MRRSRVVLGAAVLALAALGVVGWRQHRARAASRYVAPTFVDAPAGQRAASTELVGVRVGFTSLPDVKRRMAEWGVSCADRSMRTLMGEMREKKKAEIAAAQAKGQPDAVSGASLASRRTARDDNPQVRLSCDDVPAARLGDRRRPDATGRVLFVHDRGDAPLRHASFQRNHRTWEAALADYAETVTALRARYGTPVVEGSASPDAPLAKYAATSTTFRFSDLEAAASLTNLGGRGFSVRESVEVPWPVRADAPAR